MKLKLDENLGRGGLELFRAAGHDVMTVAEQSLAGTEDEDLIRVCQREARCLVTLDLGFSNPLVFKPWEYAGIAVMRLPSKPSHNDLLQTCRTLIAGLARGPIAGKLWIVQPHRFREYQPDLPDEAS